MANFFEVLDVLCEEGMSLGGPDDFPAGEPRSKASTAAAAPGDGSERDPLDFFDLLDMLAADEGGLGDVENLAGGGGGSKAKAAVVVRTKQPVGCRQRNVVRPQMLLPSIDDALLPAESRALRDSIERLLKKNATVAELRRLEYLKNATL